MATEQVESFTNVFKVLSDPTRLRILRLLLDSPSAEVCVCEIVDALEIPQYQVSRDLASLKTAGLVRNHKEGRWVYYAVDPGKSADWKELLYDALRALPVSAHNDRKELRNRLKLRRSGKCLIGIQKEHLK